jgi:signal transduction histidine kinase/CheY-like chemotaxis protein
MPLPWWFGKAGEGHKSMDEIGLPILTVAITHEPDVVIARRRARHIAKLLKFPDQDGTRVATAVSEIARNAFAYGGGGKVEFFVDKGAPPAFVIRIGDQGRGIADPDAILSGRYRSSTGMGLGIVGARRLMDEFEMRSAPGKGTTVILRKNLPGDAPPVTPKSLAVLAQELMREPHDLYEEIRQQNQELLNTLEDLRHREDDLSRLNHELEDTNRGVVALYAELDQRADQLRHADQMKSRFLSHVSHEFRTPLNSIVGLTRLLLKREAIVQSEEASREINFIQKSAQTLTDMVNDLLDLAKAESGKLLVHLTEFEVDSVFSALRGMMRPLATSDAVELIFEDPVSVPPLHSDEAMISQILRNLFSNALKFTERGEVRVSAAYSGDRDAICFSVRDTGIGIPVEHQKRIFEEFAQLDNPLQRKVKGTGLGLPLCKKLAELLGGSIHVESEAGVGSCFTAVIPRRYSGAEYSLPAASPSQPERMILLIDDEDVSRYLLRQLLDGPYRIVEAKSGVEGIEQAHKLRPDVIFLDLNMPGMSGFEVVTQLKATPGMREIPLVIVTGQKLNPVAQAALAQKTVAFLAKDVLARAEALTIDFGPPLSVSPRYPGPSGD